MSPDFLNGVDPDLRDAFFQKLRVHWTHTSTALEGNTLTAGETLEVLAKGLTISGKPLADHNEVVGHSRAIDLIYEYCRSDKSLTPEALFQLHAAIQTESVVDSLHPIGKWKVEPNSTAVVLDGNPFTNDTYAHPRDVPELISFWLEELAGSDVDARRGGADRFRAYARLHAGFVRIHPFADGIGRMARLVANLPLLRVGLPPITIPLERRVEYIETLARWQFSLGRPKPGSELVVENPEFDAFVAFCEEASREVESLVEETLRRQRERQNES